MSAVVLYIASSVDGYIADQQGGVGWLAPFEEAGEDYGYAEFLQRIGALVMGARTYRQVLGFGAWPYGEMPTYVFSHGPLVQPPGGGIEQYSGDPAQLIARISQAVEKDIWLVGGAALVDAFLRADLINELILSIIPVMLGSGIPLFSPGGAQPLLRLEAVRHYAGGVVQLHYHLRAAR